MIEHARHLAMVLQLLIKHRLYANRKKCSFACTHLEYLGYIISGDSVEVDNSKIQAMLEWLVPQSIRELRGFLGLTGYYRKFVKGYRLIAWPLTEQLKKDRFGWNNEAIEAFEALKKVMTTVPVLSLSDFTKPFVIETDASGYGLGAVLMQEEQ